MAWNKHVEVVRLGSVDWKLISNIKAHIEPNIFIVLQAHSGQHDANQFGLLYAILVDSQPGREQSVRNIWWFWFVRACTTIRFTHGMFKVLQAYDVM